MNITSLNITGGLVYLIPEGKFCMLYIFFQSWNFKLKNIFMLDFRVIKISSSLKYCNLDG